MAGARRYYAADFTNDAPEALDGARGVAYTECMAADGATRPPIRPDLREAQDLVWRHVASPGTWWTGAERIAIAEAARAAPGCRLCRARRDALSPGAVAGRHDGTAGLPDAVADVVHRIRTDSGRLSREWYEGVRTGGLGDAAYVELVGIVAMTAGFAYFARALGVPLAPFPAPRAGEPSRYRPASARPNGAWVPTVAGADAEGPEADLYRDLPRVPNIASALSLVPDEVRMLRASGPALYMGIERVGDATFRPGALTRSQMELIAARVSALNQCFY